ncbi:hypothetical protein JKY79_01015, partial [Candidatus Babeliales bacterium]|nr:hypothetical protein [Candidatus Babeliales bacterium]
IDAIPEDSLASIVEELLAAGANPFLKNINKQNAISYAKKNHPLVCIVLSNWIKETLYDNPKIFLHRLYNYLNETFYLHGNITSLLHSIKNNDVKTIKKHLIDYLNSDTDNKDEIESKPIIEAFLSMSKEDEKQQVEAVKTELRNESRALMDSIVKDDSNRDTFFKYALNRTKNKPHHPLQQLNKKKKSPKKITPLYIPPEYRSFSSPTMNLPQKNSIIIKR